MLAPLLRPFLGPLLVVSTVIQFSFSSPKCLPKPGHLSVIFDRNSCDVTVAKSDINFEIEKPHVDNCPDYCMFVVRKTNDVIVANDEEIVAIPLSARIFDLNTVEEDADLPLNCSDLAKDVVTMFGELINVSQEECSPTSKQVFIPFQTKKETLLSSPPNTRWRQLRNIYCKEFIFTNYNKFLVVLPFSIFFTLGFIVVIVLHQCWYLPQYRRGETLKTFQKPSSTDLRELELAPRLTSREEIRLTEASTQSDTDISAKSPFVGPSRSCFSLFGSDTRLTDPTEITATTQRSLTATGSADVVRRKTKSSEVIL